MNAMKRLAEEMAKTMPYIRSKCRHLKREVLLGALLQQDGLTHHHLWPEMMTHAYVSHRSVIGGEELAAWEQEEVREL